jgi:ATP-dependent Clp protease ATP-binding subunit ClpX
MSLKDYKREDSKSSHGIPKPNEIYAHLNQCIIGQDHAKHALACASYNHLFSCAHPDLETGKSWPDNHTLIAGPSGTGKSEMIRILCNFLGIPWYLVDCTNLSPSGYRGKNIENLINELEGHFASDDVLRDPCVVVWDEVDKLWDDKSEAGRYRRMVQTDCLKILEGAPVFDDIDASKILHIACGAFVGLDKLRFPVPPAQIGFHSTTGQAKPPKGTKNNQIKPEHFIQYGMIPEFIGRFSRFAVMHPLNKSELQTILTESKISFLRRKVDEYAMHGISLVFAPGAINRLADMAMAHPSGVRGMRQIITEVLEPWDYRLPNLASDGVAEIHFDEIAICHPTLAELIEGNNTHKSTKSNTFYHTNEEIPDENLGIF